MTTILFSFDLITRKPEQYLSVVRHTFPGHISRAHIASLRFSRPVSLGILSLGGRLCRFRLVTRAVRRADVRILPLCFYYSKLTAIVLIIVFLIKIRILLGLFWLQLIFWKIRRNLY